MSHFFPRPVPNVSPPEVKLVYHFLLQKGPLTTLQIQKLYPEAGDAWNLRWKLLHPMKREGLISYHWYRDPVNLQKSAFLWTLSWIHRKLDWEVAGKRRLEELEKVGDLKTLEMERLEHKLLPKTGPVNYKHLRL